MVPVQANMAWITETLIPEAKNVVVADDNLDVRTFIGQSSQGTAFLWKGDFQQAKTLLSAVNRWMTKKSNPSPPRLDPREAFHRHRQNQAHKARIQSRLLVHVEPDLSIRLPRAPDVRDALRGALENIPADGFELSLRELLGMIGAHEWRKQGVPVPILGARIHPYYGVFSPVRGEYLELVAQAPLPSSLQTAFDIGTGSGVIAAILARRGVAGVVATDMDPRALECARDNISRLGLLGTVDVLRADLFPEGRADLIVCNPPWLPARPSSRIERAVYDPDSQMLRGFLAGAAAHLSEHGEAWLILSNLAELLGLRGPEELEGWIRSAGLEIVQRMDARPVHPKAKDVDDPLHGARSREITSLWRLSTAKGPYGPS